MNSFLERLNLGVAGEPQTQPGTSTPLQGALAVLSLLCCIKVTVPAPTTLEALMWCPSSDFSLWDHGSRGLGTLHMECRTQQKGK